MFLQSFWKSSYINSRAAACPLPPFSLYPLRTCSILATLPPLLSLSLWSLSSSSSFADIHIHADYRPRAIPLLKTLFVALPRVARDSIDAIVSLRATAENSLPLASSCANGTFRQRILCRSLISPSSLSPAHSSHSLLRYENLFIPRSLLASCFRSAITPAPSGSARATSRFELRLTFFPPLRRNSRNRNLLPPRPSLHSVPRPPLSLRKLWTIFLPSVPPSAARLSFDNPHFSSLFVSRLSFGRTEISFARETLVTLYYKSASRIN